MSYLLYTYTHQPALEFAHDRITALQSEERPLSLVVDEIVRNYVKPVFITWYKLEGAIEFYLVIRKS